jgi:hypothetical protein
MTCELRKSPVSVPAQQAVARRQQPNGKSAVVATVANATNAATHASRRRLYQFD